MKEVCLSRRAFFSLNSNYLQDVYDSFIVLISKGGWNYNELYNLSVSKRDWIFGRFVELNKQKEDFEG
jgi:hypothetical protein